MGDDKPKNEPLEDGRPAEVREGGEPQPEEQVEEDIPDSSTVESIGY